MLTNVKRDFIFASAIAVAILGYGFCSDADAQTVQPVYTRPSKGPVLTVLNASQGTAAVTSPVFDWTAFTAVTATVKFSKADGTACGSGAVAGECRRNRRAASLAGGRRGGPARPFDGRVDRQSPPLAQSWGLDLPGLSVFPLRSLL